MNPASDVVPEPVRVAVTEWLDEAAPLVGLTDWEWTVADTSAEESAYASIEPVYGQRSAVVRINPLYLFADTDTTDAQIAAVLVHEMVHCHHGDLMDQLGDATKDSGAERWVESVVRHHVEHLVDAAARVIAANVDLPPIQPLRDAAR